MPVRIYALAKKLNLDNKVLVDICKKAGITGKGSALASLSEDELAKVTAYMEKAEEKTKGGPVKKAKEPEAKAIRREDYMAPGGKTSGKVPVLDVKTEKPKPKPPPVKKTPKKAPVEEKPAPGPVKAKAKAKKKKPKEEPAERKPAKKAKKKPQEPDAGEKRKPPKPTEKAVPAVKLAPVPTSKARPGKPKPQEPTPQKPDIKLPPGAFQTGGNGGAKPLSEHLRKHEKKKAAAKKASTRKEGATKPATPAEPSRRDRHRRGRAGAAPKDSDAPMLGGREARQLKRKRVGGRRRRGDDDDRNLHRRRTRIRRTGANTAAPRKGKVSIQVPCTVREFSEAIGVAAKIILGKLLELGTMSNIAANLDHEMAELLAVELGVEVNLQQQIALEEKVLAELQQEDDSATLQPRPPIVTFLGHVDHGKTSLLDCIIDTNVVSEEKGGITQHIRAYRVEKGDRAVAFVDTPGHEAFTEMRARGANVTDIAVLVVAADDGVMPQTEEAISHARAAEVPIVVAMNKIDLPGADEQKVYTQLANNDLLPTEWSGDTDVIKTSAVTREGIDELLETLLTIAELHEYQANPDRKGMGTCLEAELHEGRGVITKLLVQKGTLRVGDVIVCGPAHGRVKAMYDTLDPKKQHDLAPPSTPVNVTGLNVPPNAGDRFFVLDDVSQARTLAEQRATDARQRELSGARSHVTLENLIEHLDQQEVQTLRMILRADVQGSIEAIRKELTKLEHPEVEIKILQSTVGGITEADVHLADASDAVIIGFNVVPDEGARQLAEQRGVQVRRYDIIYQVTEDLRAALEGMLKPEQQEKDLGHALVKQMFRIGRTTIAGCQVLSGTVQRDANARVIRESRIIGDYPVESLRREKDDVREVRSGYECGMKLKGFNDFKEGDILEVYHIEEIRRTFEANSAAQAGAST